MGFRFYKRINILPGLSINLGKKGASLSVGPRGAKMTIGPNGTRTSVGIPGTGIRYEKRYGRGSYTKTRTPSSGGGNIWFILALFFASAFALSYQFHKVDSKSMLLPIIMSIAGALAILFFVIGCGVWVSSAFVSMSDKAARKYSVTKNKNYDRYINELASASNALYAFFRELSRSRRCVRKLNDLPGMDCVGSDTKKYWTINPRLALIVYCDLRDCFRRLGHNPARLSGLSGIGYSMIVTLLISRDFDFNNFHNLDVAVKMMGIVSELTETGQAELDIHGQDVDFRFAFLLGTVNGENEWVQRYATLMYRWASLIAKADGTVTAAESSTLATILKMHELSSGDNVRVSGSVDAMPENNANEIDEDVDVPQKVEEGKLASPKEQKSVKALMCSLDKLIGLVPVKQDVKTLAHFIEIQKKRRQAGLREAPVSYHCVFTGNPGTGKTTVARILADIYREMGVVNKGHLVETDRSGLVAEYVGQTAVKTNKVIDSALDGVLFIDEAYTLVQGGNNDYGGEAIATLLKRMEDDRDRLVVILAGYTDEMKRFIDSNPGLHSRFNRYINFPDYSAQELSEIFLLTAAKSQYVCNDDVKASLVQIMEHAVQSKDENFGNGRYVRNLFEKAIQRQAVRLSSVAPITAEMLTELTLHDLGFEYED